jgi:hypothetical protein
MSSANTYTFKQFMQLIDFSILLFLMGKKSNKRTQPRDAESSLIQWFPKRGQKLSVNMACRGALGRLRLSQLAGSLAFIRSNSLPP